MRPRTMSVTVFTVTPNRSAIRTDGKPVECRRRTSRTWDDVNFIRSRDRGGRSDVEGHDSAPWNANAS